MKKIIFVLVCNLSLYSSIALHKNLEQSLQQSKVVSQTILQEQWVNKALTLGNNHKKKLIIFLGSMANLYPNLKNDRRKAIDSAINQLLTHSQNQIEQIKQFLRLEKIVLEQKESFSLKKLIKNSTNSQGSNRMNMAMALQEITIDNPLLIEAIARIDNSMKQSSDEQIFKDIEEIDCFLNIIKEFQILISNNKKDPVTVCKELKNQLENQNNHNIQAQALSMKNNETFSTKLQGLWTSMVDAFKKYF